MNPQTVLRLLKLCTAVREMLDLEQHFFDIGCPVIYHKAFFNQGAVYSISSHVH